MCRAKYRPAVIFDDELTGSQILNIEKELKVVTIDRSDLILDIFARRARTAQMKVQVELAQYQYLLPRLKGMETPREARWWYWHKRAWRNRNRNRPAYCKRQNISLRKKLSDIDRQAFTKEKTVANLSGGIGWLYQRWQKHFNDGIEQK